MSMESTTIRAKKLGSDFAMFGRYISNDEIIEKIEKTSAQSLKSIAKKIIKSDITITTLGNVANIYNYSSIVDRLKT